MKKWITKYSLEIFSTAVLIFISIVLLFFPEISYIRKLVLSFAILAVLHEFEEKRTPGGFYELMAKKFGMSMEKANFDLASFFVICYWVVLIVLAFVFDEIEFFLMMSIALGIFEAFIHTAGIWIHKMKKPYTPGLASAWPMAALSIYSIVYLNAHTDITGIDYLIGTLMMIVGFAIMGRGTMYAAGMTLKDVKQILKDKLTKK